MSEEENGVEEQSPLEAFLEASHEELDQVDKKLKEITMLVEQSQGEVDKLAQRNATVTAHIHQIQGHFDTVPREDIRSAYEAAQDAQQRLFTMRGQLEKLQSDEAHLKRLLEFMAESLRLLEGRPAIEIEEEETKGGNTLEKIIEAQEEERQKISRQLHDGPAQDLSNFILQTEIASRLFDTDLDQARQELNSLKEAAATSFSHVRDFIFDLRPMMLDDLGLLPTVRRYIEAMKDKTGMDLNLVFTGDEQRLESHREVIIFRAIQSLLVNVRDHAQATQIKVMMDLADNQVRVSVEDNGKGFDSENLDEDEVVGRSLITLRERIEQFEGTFDLDSEPGEGTRIAFSIPTSA